MNSAKKIALRILAYPFTNFKKYYKAHRKVLKIVHPYLKSRMNFSDYMLNAEGREIPVRVFTPKKENSKGILLFFHGGGWVTGSIDSYTNICSHMADQTQHTVVSTGYRLAPENPFPSGVEDCYLVAREALLNGSFFNFKTENITLIGESAGGNLAAAVSLMARDRGEFIPKRQILLYPCLNNNYMEKTAFPSSSGKGKTYILTHKRMQDFFEMYVQNKEYKNNPYAAPLLAPDLSNQPATLVITAEHDILKDEGMAYGIRLRESGNHVSIHCIKNALHGFFSLPWISGHAKESYKIINRFLMGNEPKESIELRN